MGGGGVVAGAGAVVGGELVVGGSVGGGAVAGAEVLGAEVVERRAVVAEMEVVVEATPSPADSACPHAGTATTATTAIRRNRRAGSTGRAVRRGSFTVSCRSRRTSPACGWPTCTIVWKPVLSC